MSPRKREPTPHRRQIGANTADRGEMSSDVTGTRTSGVTPRVGRQARCGGTGRQRAGSDQSRRAAALPAPQQRPSGRRSCRHPRRTPSLPVTAPVSSYHRHRYHRITDTCIIASPTPVSSHHRHRYHPITYTGIIASPTPVSSYHRHRYHPITGTRIILSPAPVSSHHLHRYHPITGTRIIASPTPVSSYHRHRRRRRRHRRGITGRLE